MENCEKLTLRKFAHAIYRYNYLSCKKKNSVEKNIFVFAQNIDCEYMLEPPQQFYYIKVEFKRVYFSWTCFPHVKCTI